MSSTMQSGDLSLHNQSLSSIKGSDTSSKDREKYLKYNKPARKELLRLMTKNHLKSHCRDVDNTLTCHNINYDTTTKTYIEGPYILTRLRIYSFIYLGLLIINGKIQLVDLIRFIREGVVSYHNVDHFLPEEFRELNVKSWNDGNSFLCHHKVRILTGKLAKLLDVTKYVRMQNLTKLCQRYFNELNLPGIIA